MQFHQMANDCKTESQTSVCARDRAVRLAETIKDVGKELGTDPLTRIAHRYFQERPEVFEPYFYLSFLGSKFDGIREQVPDYLLQSNRIGGYLSGPGVENYLKPYRFS